MTSHFADDTGRKDLYIYTFRASRSDLFLGQLPHQPALQVVLSSQYLNMVNFHDPAVIVQDSCAHAFFAMTMTCNLWI